VYVQIFNVGAIAFLYPKLAIGIPFTHIILFNSERTPYSRCLRRGEALGLNEGAYFSEM